MPRTLSLVLAAVLTAPPSAQTSGDPDPASQPEGIRIERWDGEHDLYVPRGEELVYRVRISLTLIDAPVGTVTLSSGAEPYRKSVLLAPQAGAGEELGETAWMRCRAKGDYAWYSMDATVEARVHPVDWPWIVYRYIHTGTKNRRVENLIGWRDEQPFSRYRRDTSHGAPKGTRIWKEPHDRVLPDSALDMLTSVYYAREMVRKDLQTMSFTLVDKLKLWKIDLRRGRRMVQKTYAGEFDALEIILEPRLHPDEERDEKDAEKEEQFEGLFGIQGSIHLWVEAETGIPVRIQGDLPLGPLDLGIEVILQSFRGTPPAFRPKE